MTTLMKGKVWADHKHKLVYPVYVEHKLDEIRCEVRREADGTVSFWSYADKPLHNLALFKQPFERAMEEMGVYVLDIGIEVNGNFNDSYRWTRSSTGYPKEKLDKATGKVSPALAPEMVKFLLFDIPDHAGPYSQRVAYMAFVTMPALLRQGLNVFRPKLNSAQSEEEVEQLFIEARTQCVEGVMVKAPTHLYQHGKRSDDWLKMKPEAEADGVIVGFVQAVSIEGVPLDRTGSIQVQLEDGSTATPAGIPHELGRDMHSNPEKYLGRWVMFKYMERDRKGGYRHPSFVRFREDK